MNEVFDDGHAGKSELGELREIVAEQRRQLEVLVMEVEHLGSSFLEGNIFGLETAEELVLEVACEVRRRSGAAESELYKAALEMSSDLLEEAAYEIWKIREGVEDGDS